MLQCPKCKEALLRKEHSYECVNHHNFDIAKRGYVNLLLQNNTHSGDDKEMMKARTNFLNQDYYQPLCDALCTQLSKLAPKTLIDAGCGEGFYTNQMKQALKNCDVYGFDLSKTGVDEACKAHLDVTYGVANVFHLPLFDSFGDVFVSIFAPYDLNEIDRVLKKSGYFIKVGPGVNHLMELKEVVYEQVYKNQMEEIHDSRFQKVSEQTIEYTIQLNKQENIHALFQMTPYYWKSPKEGSERLFSLEYLQTKVQFQLEVYQKV